MPAKSRKLAETAFQDKKFTEYENRDKVRRSLKTGVFDVEIVKNEASGDQAPASSGFLLRVEFESSSSKKFEYRVEYRVAIAVVGSVILDVIIISDIAVILSRLDWILK